MKAESDRMDDVLRAATAVAAQGGSRHDQPRPTRTYSKSFRVVRVTTDSTLGAAMARPPEERGPALFACPESQWFDRKSVRIKATDLAHTLVAFANAEGGTVVIGLHAGQVEGIDANPQRANEARQAAIDHTVPPVRARCRELECKNGRGGADHLLVIEVDPSEGVHATSRDEVYLRVGDEDRKLSFTQRQELLYDKGQAQFDGTPVRGAGLSDLDPEIIANFSRAVAHPEPERALVARGLVTSKGEVTAAAWLLFGRHPQSEFPEAHVRVLRHQGTARETGQRQRLLQDHRFDGPIPIVLGEAREAVRRLEPKRRFLGTQGVFVRQGIIPEDAWLEGIVNAVVHRSYSLGGDHIRVDIFDDRIEIESPGRFPGLVSVEDPRTVVRFARNPRIARVCADLDFGQELGEGIRRMFDEMRARGLAQPLYRQTAATVRLTLSGLAVDPTVAATLPPGYLAILDAIRRGAGLSTGDLAEALGISRPTLLRQLSSLREAGLIDWVGKSTKDPRAYWRLHSE